MADDERRAEIEAVARAWWAHDPAAFDGLTPEWRALQMRRAEAAVVALDRVRDARGDDVWTCRCGHITKVPRCEDCGRARSPQGEDHERLCDDEALVQRAARALARCSPPALDLPWDDLPAADRAPYEDAAIAVLMELGDTLSRVSPSRDGTVAVEDVVRWLRATDGWMPTCDWNEVAADEIERQFGSARAGESNEGGNQ